MKTCTQEKVDDIIFDKPTIKAEDFPEIMWKKKLQQKKSSKEDSSQ